MRNSSQRTIHSYLNRLLLELRASHGINIVAIDRAGSINGNRHVFAPKFASLIKRIRQGEFDRKTIRTLEREIGKCFHALLNCRFRFSGFGEYIRGNTKVEKVRGRRTPQVQTAKPKKRIIKKRI